MRAPSAIRENCHFTSADILNIEATAQKLTSWLAVAFMPISPKYIGILSRTSQYNVHESNAINVITPDVRFLETAKVGKVHAYKALL